MRRLITTVAASLGLLAMSIAPALAQPVPALFDAPPTTAEHDPHGDDSMLTADGARPDSFFDVFTELSASTDLGAKTYTTDDVPTSGLGLWWRDVTESVSLALTFDAAKKAEKGLRYSEERMSMAAAMLAKDPTDTDLQDKAFKMVERSEKLLGKVEADSDKWLDKAADKAGDLARKVAAHAASRESVLDRMEGRMLGGGESEWDIADVTDGTYGRITDATMNRVGDYAWDRINDGTWTRFQELRAQTDESSRRLMSALDNENIPEDVRAHLGKVKMGIESFAADREALNEVQKELLDMRKAGEEGADAALNALRAERQDMLKRRGAKHGIWGTGLGEGLQMEADVEDEFGGGRPPRQGMEADVEDEFGGRGAGMQQDNRQLQMEADVEDELGGGENEWDLFLGAPELRSRIMDRLRQDGAAGFAPRDWLDGGALPPREDMMINGSCLAGDPDCAQDGALPPRLRLDPRAQNLGLPPREDIMINGSCLAGDPDCAQDGALPREDIMINGSCLAGDPDCGTQDGFMIQREPVEASGLDAQRFPDYVSQPN